MIVPFITYVEVFAVVGTETRHSPAVARPGRAAAGTLWTVATLHSRWLVARVIGSLAAREVEAMSAMSRDPRRRPQSAPSATLPRFGAATEALRWTSPSVLHL